MCKSKTGCDPVLQSDELAAVYAAIALCLGNQDFEIISIAPRDGRCSANGEPASN